MAASPARRPASVAVLAAQAVAAVLAGRSLTPTLDGLVARHPELDANNRAALWDIVHGSLRQLGLIEAAIEQLLRKPLAEPQLRALLASSLYRLQFTRAADYAVVDQAVEATTAMGCPWAKGLVNAVLRRFLRERESVLAAARATDRGRYSYPDWWIERVRAAYPENWQAVLDNGNRPPKTGLRVNRRRTSRERYLEGLRAAGLEGRPCQDTGILLEQLTPVARLPEFASGSVSIQDLGAQLAAGYLDLAPGQRVLDACAAPGGKSAHVLEAEDVELLALDIDEQRLARVAQNLERLGLKAQLVRADAGEPAAWWDGRGFARVLADVPCTASGVVRRHPDIKWLRRESDAGALARSSAQLLDSLWQVLEPGGKLLFATCSIWPEENQAQVAGFLGRHADARLVPLPGTDCRDLQLLPDDSHDGFYYALLERC